MGSHGTEIAQAGFSQRIEGFADIPRHIFDMQLASSIGIDYLLRIGLVNGQILRVTVNGHTAAENETRNGPHLHRYKQRNRTTNIVVKLLSRQLHRFTGQFISRQVDDGVDAMLAKDKPHKLCVSYVALNFTRFSRQFSTSSSNLLEVHRAQLVEMAVLANAIVETLDSSKNASRRSMGRAGEKRCP